MEGDADIFGLAQFGHMDVVRRIGAAHVERVLGAVGAHHAERGEEFFLFVEIGRTQPPVSEIGDFDDGHDNLSDIDRRHYSQKRMTAQFPDHFLVRLLIRLRFRQEARIFP